MPIFEYRCGDCGAVSEFLTGVSQEQPEIACSDCGGTSLTKLFSLANFVKGSVGCGARDERGDTPCGVGPDSACGHCRFAD